MNSINTLSSDFKKEWDRVGVYHGKGLIKNVPKWEEILNILNTATRYKDPSFNLQTHTYYEIIYKNLIAMKKIEYHKEFGYEIVESDATFFYSLFFNPSTFGSIISKSLENQVMELDKILNIESQYTSLKISLSNKFVPYETHHWDTCILHIAGTTDWRLKGGSHGPEKLYVLEPGDILFFKQGIEHELTNENPRSSLVGNFNIRGNSEQ